MLWEPDALADPVVIAECEFGLGLFASSDLMAGDVILRFTGPQIGMEEAISKGDAKGNVLQVGPKDYIDTAPPGLFANHSCEPNAGVRNDTVLIAIEAIAAGAEIRFDYSTTMWEPWDGAWTMRCSCKSRFCRNVVASFFTLPTSLQARYLSMGIVQQFILHASS